MWSSTTYAKKMKIVLSLRLRRNQHVSPADRAPTKHYVGITFKRIMWTDPIKQNPVRYRDTDNN